MNNNNITSISNYSSMATTKLKEMTNNSVVYTNFLIFQGRVFKHNIGVST